MEKIISEEDKLRTEVIIKVLFIDAIVIEKNKKNSINNVSLKEWSKDYLFLTNKI